MTNYEKIKSLSLDKMAEFLVDNVEMPCEMCPCNVDDYKCTGSNYDCKKTLKKWLKAESEED